MAYSRVIYLLILGGLVWLLFTDYFWVSITLLSLFLFLTVASIALSFWNRGKVDVILQCPEGMEQGNNGKILLYAVNRSHLSVPMVVAKVSCTNSLTGNTVDHIARFPVSGKGRHKEVIKFNDAEIGHIDVLISDLYMTDALHIIRFHLPANQHSAFLVEPPTLPVFIRQGEAMEMEGTSSKYSEHEPGHDVSETFDHRDYQAGDSIRSIHWKLSAKMGDLVVREYSKPVEFSLVLLLELAKSSPEALQSCISYVVGISRELLDEGLLHTIAWYDAAEDEYCSVNVTSYETLEAAILRMIVSGPSDSNSESLQRFLEDLTPSGNKKTLLYFTTDFNNTYGMEAADLTFMRTAVIGRRGLDTADPVLSVETLPEDSQSVRFLRLDMENDDV